MTSSVFAALVHGVILSALTTALVWLGLHAAPRRALNAATRYVVWWSALAVSVALPAVFLPVLSFQSTGIVTPASAAPVARNTSLERVMPLTRAAPPSPIQASQSVPRPRYPIEVYDGRYPEWMLAAGAAASLLMLFRLIVSCVALERRKARAAAASEHLAGHVEEWLARCGSTRRGVRIACSAEIATPMVAGLRRPTILIPARLLGELDESELEQIGLHEAAHLARGDDYALIFQRFIEALFAWHPVVGSLARQIDLEREIACDDLVVSATGRPGHYAACLTRVAEMAGGVRVSPPAAAVAEEGSHLATRVEALLDKTGNKGTRVLKARLAAAGAALAALSCLAAKTPRLVAFVPRPSAPLEQVSSSAVPAPPQPTPPARGAAQKPQAQPAPLVVPHPDNPMAPIPVTVTDPVNVVTGLAQKPQAPPAPPVVPYPDRPMVLIPVNVTDPLNRFVTGLEKHEFRLFEDGIEQEIVQFSSEDTAISVGIVFDTSGSMGKALENPQQAMEQFMAARPGDEFVIIQFRHRRPQLIPGFRQDALAAKQSGGRTALLDSVYTVLHQMKKSRNPRKAILIVSDGGEDSSRYRENEVVSIVREAGARIYAIGIANPLTQSGILLDEIATQSGGRHFPIDSPQQLQDVAAKIAVELRNQYVLGYIPKNTVHDGGYRTVEVKFDQPRGLPPLRVISPDGYYAPAQ